MKPDLQILIEEATYAGNTYELRVDTKSHNIVVYHPASGRAAWLNTAALIDAAIRGGLHNDTASGAHWGGARPKCKPNR